MAIRHNNKTKIVRVKFGRLVRVKCYAVGCRRSTSGYVRSDGGFLNSKGDLVANLREQDFACAKHGIDKPAFLDRDTDAGPRSKVSQ